ncbi:hypothetical protein J6590_083413 [Homalodisca vitripennis]|nr:hypothetical protein J6590_083413 [Homalodisca vitripennis]
MLNCSKLAAGCGWFQRVQLSLSQFDRFKIASANFHYFIIHPPVTNSAPDPTRAKLFKTTQSGRQAALVGAGSS